MALLHSSAPALLLVLASILVSASSEGLHGVKCSDHPLHKPRFRGELIRSWAYSRRTESRLYFTSSGYLPRYTKHVYAPSDDLKSNKYRELDYFASNLPKNMPDDMLTLTFQRPAKVYLLVNGHNKALPKITLPGWHHEGWATLIEGTGKVNVGITNSMRFYAPKHVAVFSKKTDTEIILPSKAWVGSNLRGLEKDGYYNVLVSEWDGSAVTVPRLPSGKTANAGGRCPAELHDSWTVAARDSDDPDMRGRRFRTAHPLWDPCFWCAYDHEHGSMARQLMGYDPLFGYVALKNGNEAESHNGFKGMVLDAGGHYLFLGFHGKLSDARRFFKRHHTVVVAAVEKESRALVLELSFKADFGFLAVRAADHRRIPLRPVDATLQAKQRAAGLRDAMRVVNVIDPRRPDPRYAYKNKGKFILKGAYELWIAVPMCADLSRLRGPQFDVKNPQMALRTAKSGPGDIVRLGRERDGEWHEHVGTSRDVRFKNLELAFEHCGLGEEPKTGVFYTDVYGKKRLLGPGKGAVRQYIKPGARLFFKGGLYKPDDTWLGLQKTGVISEMRDISYSVDARAN